LQNRTESFQKAVSIGIVFKNVSSLHTPAYDMMQETRRIYSGLTWHVTSLSQTNEKRNGLLSDKLWASVKELLIRSSHIICYKIEPDIILHLLDIVEDNIIGKTRLLTAKLY